MILRLFEPIFARIRNRLIAGLARQEDLDVMYNQIAGLFQIQNAMRGEAVLKPMRGWALSPDAMACVLADLQKRTMPTIIEFGSGQSTIVIAAALKHHGGRLISVEHDPDYSKTIQEQAAACRVSDMIEFVHSPLIGEESAPHGRSYDLTALPNVQVDVALIDGPPIMNGTYTRLSPLRWAVQHLTQAGSVFLDDAARESERLCIHVLQREFPNLKTTNRITEKGLLELCLNA
jgi:predicted O-methyltransferase YrrM